MVYCLVVSVTHLAEANLKQNHGRALKNIHIFV